MMMIFNSIGVNRYNSRIILQYLKLENLFLYNVRIFNIKMFYLKASRHLFLFLVKVSSHHYFNKIIIEIDVSYLITIMELQAKYLTPEVIIFCNIQIIDIKRFILFLKTFNLELCKFHNRFGHETQRTPSKEQTNLRMKKIPQF